MKIIIIEMEDPTIDNFHIFSYFCQEEVPDKVKESLMKLSQEHNLDPHFYVNAVRNRTNTYINKGFIYTSSKNFDFLCKIIRNETDLNSEDVFYFEDEDGFPVNFEVHIANVYEFDSNSVQNKLVCGQVPPNVTSGMLEKVFGNFATKKQVKVRNGNVLFFPRINFKNTVHGRSVIVSFEDSTDDAHYAFIMTRRLDLCTQDKKQISLIFSPCKAYQQNKSKKSKRDRGRW